MSRELILKISSILDIPELKQALYCKDYLLAYEIVLDQVCQLKEKYDTYIFVDQIKYALSKKDKNLIKETLNNYLYLYLLDNILEVLDFYYYKNSDSDEDIELYNTYVKENTQPFFAALKYINLGKYEVEESFIDELINNFEDIQPGLKAIKYTFSLPIILDSPDENPLTKYIEAILTSYQFDEAEIGMSIMNNNYKYIIEQVQIISYLMDLLSELKKIKVEELV